MKALFSLLISILMVCVLGQSLSSAAYQQVKYKNVEEMANASDLIVRGVALDDAMYPSVGESFLSAPVQLCEILGGKEAPPLDTVITVCQTASASNHIQSGEEYLLYLIADGENGYFIAGKNQGIARIQPFPFGLEMIMPYGDDTIILGGETGAKNRRSGTIIGAGCFLFCLMLAVGPYLIRRAVRAKRKKESSGSLR